MIPRFVPSWNKALDNAPILVGADDPLPHDHFWFAGDGFSIYTAKRPTKHME